MDFSIQHGILFVGWCVFLVYPVFHLKLAGWRAVALPVFQTLLFFPAAFFAKGLSAYLAGQLSREIDLF